VGHADVRGEEVHRLVAATRQPLEVRVRVDVVLLIVHEADGRLAVAVEVADDEQRAGERAALDAELGVVRLLPGLVVVHVDEQEVAVRDALHEALGGAAHRPCAGRPGDTEAGQHQRACELQIKPVARPHYLSLFAAAPAGVWTMEGRARNDAL
jgi:hypothetical protein